MAPEQVIGFADASSDIFNLAKVLIEMLAGQRFSMLVPHPVIDLPDQADKLLAAHCPDLSSVIRKQISAALAFDPTLRPHHAREFAQNLANALRDPG